MNTDKLRLKAQLSILRDVTRQYGGLTIVIQHIMNALLTLDDFPGDRANCATCTRKGGACPRREKRYPNGYVKSSVNGDFTGIIYRCPNYTGPYENEKEV